MCKFVNNSLLVLLLLSCVCMYSQESVKTDSLAATLDSLVAAGNTDGYYKALGKAYVLAKSKNDSLLEMQSLRRLADFFLANKTGEDSLVFYQRTLKKTAEAYRSAKFKTNADYIWARHLSDSGQYAEAYQLFMALEPVIKDNGYDFLPHFYSAFARLHYRLKEYDLAFEKLKKASKINKDNNFLTNTSANYNNLGILYRVRKQYDSSLVYHQKSLDISTALKDTLSIAYSYNNMGLIHADLNRLREAEMYYQNALAINPTKPSEAFLTNYSSMLIGQGRSREAEEMLLGVIDKTEAPQIKIDAFANLVALKKTQGKYQEALELSDRLISLKEDLINSDKLAEIERLKAAHDTENKEKEISVLKETTKIQAVVIDKNKTLLFITLIVVFLLLIIAGLVMRNRLVSSKAKKLVLEQQLLRSQMNPHFIFNALSNIQSAILNNENSKAVSYLAKFSKLVRNILENSKDVKITFGKEIQSVKSYLDLQQIRFDDSFTYTIIVDENIEEDLIYIPTMLLQPIVENALEHGIDGLDDGVITIECSLQNQWISCTVIDNGAGVSATAKELNPDKTSMSSQIIKDRLGIHSKKLKHSLHFSVTDHYVNGYVAGTKVLIEIPIL